MPKRVFWPVALLVMGLIFMASSLGMLPPDFANLWPLILIVVGLGGLLTSDREDWMASVKSKRAPSKARRSSRRKK